MNGFANLDFVVIRANELAKLARDEGFPHDAQNLFGYVPFGQPTVGQQDDFGNDGQTMPSLGRAFLAVDFADFV